MPTKDTITPQQLRKIAAALRWRGATLPKAESYWRTMTPEDRQWWIAEARAVVTHAGLVVAGAGA